MAEKKPKLKGKESELAQGTNEFYEFLRRYHESDKVRNLFRMYRPQGIQITSTVLTGIATAEDKGENRHPVEKYALIYGRAGNGFEVRAYWRGDFFAHQSEYDISIQDGVIYCNVNDKKGQWPLLDAFPELVLSDLEKIGEACKTMEREHITRKESLESILK